MADFVAALAADKFENWAVWKKASLWGIVGKVSNWRNNGERVVRGDRIFVWRSGVKGGFIAQVETQGPMELVGEGRILPAWKNYQDFGAVIPIKLKFEVATPIPDNFTGPSRMGVRFGFNNPVWCTTSRRFRWRRPTKSRGPFLSVEPPDRDR